MNSISIKRLKVKWLGDLLLFQQGRGRDKPEGGQFCFSALGYSMPLSHSPGQYLSSLPLGIWAPCPWSECGHKEAMCSGDGHTFPVPLSHAFCHPLFFMFHFLFSPSLSFHSLLLPPPLSFVCWLHPPFPLPSPLPNCKAPGWNPFPIPQMSGELKAWQIFPRSKLHRPRKAELAV